MPVDGDVPFLHFGVAHPQWDDQADQLEEDEGADRGEHDHPQPGDRLPLEQVQAATGDGSGERRFGHRLVGEDADHEAAEEAGEPVGVDDAEGVVDVAEGPYPAQVVEREVDQGAGDDADHDRAPAVDEPGRRRDPDEADDHPVDAADQARLAAGEVVPGDPDEQGDGGAEVGVEHGGRSDAAGFVPVTTVEAVPTQPEEPGPDRDHRQVVRCVDLAVTLQARTDHPCRDESGDAGRQMDDVTTGEVDRALLGEVATAPDQEGVDRVDEARSRARRTGSTL